MSAGLRLEGAMRYLLGFLLAVLSFGTHADSSRTETVEGGGGLPIAARLPQAQVSVFADSGNMPFWFDAAKFNRRIAEFAMSLNGR